MTFGWELPAGVTGNEPEIAGWPPCRGCGHDVEDHESSCGVHDAGIEDVECTCADVFGKSCQANGCPCMEYRDEFDPWLDGPDPDVKRDREREGW